MQPNELQAAARALTGTAGHFNEDLHAALDLSRVAPGHINERLITYSGASSASAAMVWLLENGFIAGIIASYNGSLYLPSDTNCFQDSAGTIAGAKDTVVGYLRDLVGTNHLTQATAGFKPILRKGTKTGSTSDGVGNWWLDFDGVDDRLEIASALISGANGHTSVASFVPQSVTGTRSILDADDGATRISQLLRTDTTNLQSIAFNTTPAAFTAAKAGVTLGGNFVASQQTTTSKVTAYLNGLAGADTAITGTLKTGSGKFTLGRYGGNAQYFLGGIYGAAHIPEVTSASERQTLEKYLGSLAGVTL